jgi:DNA-binding MarR family transcriptional regulator
MLRLSMSAPQLADLLERVVVAGVAITTRALNEAMPDLDLTFPQWRVLLVVGEGSDGATVSEVSSRIGVTLPATSRQLRRLARRGLVVISRDDRDRRAARARLTSDGVVVRDRILGYRHRRIAETVAGWRVSRATSRPTGRAGGDNRHWPHEARSGSNDGWRVSVPGADRSRRPYARGEEAAA